MEYNQIVLFRNKDIRRTLYEKEWWFSVVDVVEALTESNKPRVYWNAMKTRLKLEDGIELSTICRQLKLEAEDGKMRETDCANPEGLFRIIQSIPSPKAEPFKRWLAKVGYERMQEIDIAGGARKQLEKKLKKSIVSRNNFKELDKKRMR